MDLEPTHQSTHDPTAEAILADPEKVTILPGDKYDAMTFSLKDEDHTLGNSLRYIIMKNPEVEFCGYSLPHPSEPKLHLRIQMYDNKSAAGALAKGLDDLEQLVLVLAERYRAELDRGKFERFEEPTVDERLEDIKRRKYPHLLKDPQGDITMNS
ncbi:RNA polymerase subunit AC19 [Puccinia graminis f. sp. tritici]|uniref:DNA-directed RNA polymerases I and III subunit RPAC2 n=2 Tax=Puccinia graminis f. sp. tritici TaxID=56615 RepID=A0A5B0MNE8_PUCGR|nr:RNA polymerase subunit AC19 [Puccinia graminis f. sp. tritici]KAA1078002.1 RNA polymerase subunit AC19 [Puccinia graminis f. sp. tritici]